MTNRYLIGWEQRRKSPQYNRSSDYLAHLETLYKKVFPERSFNGVEYQPSNDSPTELNTYFTINDGSRTYDIVEMSAGEQAIFPMLYEIVRLVLGKKRN
ncbi:MAG: hypothetical protein J7647_23445 [Cyanobacteria bacterium SBLK]|nr:hypothetical protein [Cyanobacteria bacterium SBLK]